MNFSEVSSVTVYLERFLKYPWQEVEEEPARERYVCVCVQSSSWWQLQAKKKKNTTTPNGTFKLTSIITKFSFKHKHVMEHVIGITT